MTVIVIPVYNLQVPKYISCFPFATCAFVGVHVNLSLALFPVQVTAVVLA